MTTKVKTPCRLNITCKTLLNKIHKYGLT